MSRILCDTARAHRKSYRTYARCSSRHRPTTSPPLRRREWAGRSSCCLPSKSALVVSSKKSDGRRRHTVSPGPGCGCWRVNKTITNSRTQSRLAQSHGPSEHSPGTAHLPALWDRARHLRHARKVRSSVHVKALQLRGCCGLLQHCGASFDAEKSQMLHLRTVHGH